MSTAAHLQSIAAKPKPLGISAHAGLLLQRKCACGSPTSSLIGECTECKNRKLVQTKLAIGTSNDPLEREADRIADQVLAAPAQSAASGVPPHIQRSTGQPGAPVGTAPTSVNHVLASPGRPLDPALQQDMEQRFGHDFSRVRVHSDAAGERSAREVDAYAYTVGHDLVFGAGRFAPATHEGRSLIAHELTHVVQQSGGVQGMRGLSVQRKPDNETKVPNAPKPKQAPPKPSKQKGLNRTLYVVHNDIWNKLPPAVRVSAEQELKRLFSFVGASGSEKPFSIKVVTAPQLPEQFDFSESIVSVIRGDTSSYVKDAFARQNEQVRSWLAQQKVPTAATTSRGKAPFNPERVGTGGGSRSLRTDRGQTFALLVMAGAVDIDEVIDSFFDNIDSLLEDQLTALPKNGRDPTKWPPIVHSRAETAIWDPQSMLGAALGRAIAHEARHEYIGAAHAQTGLGQDSPFIIGEKTSAQFSKKDQKAILDKIRKLEAMQGKAAVVPTFPQSMRKKPEQFPF